MQAEQLLRLLQNPHKTTPEDVVALHNLLKLYPYFQAAYALIAKEAYDRDQHSARQEIQTAAVYATDRHHLKALLEDTPPFSAPTPEVAPAISAPKEEEVTPNTTQYDWVANSYINAIKQKKQRTITNPKSLAQLNSIQAFLQKEVHFKPQAPQDVSSEGLQVDFTQESTTLNDNLVTENLAQVLRQQGKLQRAVAVYEKLMLKLPKKKAYFADLIEAIKGEM